MERSAANHNMPVPVQALAGSPELAGAVILCAKGLNRRQSGSGGNLWRPPQAVDSDSQDPLAFFDLMLKVVNDTTLLLDSFDIGWHSDMILPNSGYDCARDGNRLLFPKKEYGCHQSEQSR
jgi:hypothetical protein